MILINLVFIWLLIRQIAIVLIAIWTYATGDAPFQSTQKSVIKHLVTEFSIPEGQIFDLGSGSGKAIFELAHYLPNQFVGVEQNTILDGLARARRFFRFDRRRFIFVKQNIFQVNLRQAKIIYLYLSPAANRKLVPKFDRELPSGAVVITTRFSLKSRQLKMIKKIAAKYPVFIYQKKKQN